MWRHATFEISAQEFQRRQRTAADSKDRTMQSGTSMTHSETSNHISPNNASGKPPPISNFGKQKA